MLALQVLFLKLKSQLMLVVVDDDAVVVTVSITEVPVVVIEYYHLEYRDCLVMRRKLSESLRAEKHIA